MPSASPPKERRTRWHVTQVRKFSTSETKAQHSRTLCLQTTGHAYSPTAEPAGGQAAPRTQALLGTGVQNRTSPVPSSGVNVQPAETSSEQNHFTLQSFRRGIRQQHLMRCLPFKRIRVGSRKKTGAAGSFCLPVHMSTARGHPAPPGSWLALCTPRALGQAHALAAHRTHGDTWLR